MNPFGATFMLYIGKHFFVISFGKIKTLCSCFRSTYLHVVCVQWYFWWTQFDRYLGNTRTTSLSHLHLDQDLFQHDSFFHHSHDMLSPVYRWQSSLLWRLSTICSTEPFLPFHRSKCDFLKKNEDVLTQPKSYQFCVYVTRNTEPALPGNLLF